MPQFRNLEYTSDISTSDQVAIWETASGQPKRGSVAALIALATASDSEETIEYTSITVDSEDGTGIVVCGTADGDLWTVCTVDDSETSLDILEITLPTIASAVDGQVVRVSLDVSPSSSATASSAGATVYQDETPLSTTFTFAYKYSERNLSWYAI